MNAPSFRTHPDDISSLPAQLRRLLRPLLPERAFLHRARGDATFITDAPRHTSDLLLPRFEAAGFRCTLQGSCLLLSPGPAFLTEFERNHPEPPDFLCASLLRFRGRPPCEESLALFAVGVRLLESGDAREREQYARRARSLAAVCLRKDLGGAYACALLIQKPS